MTKTKQKILYLITQSEWGGAQKYVFDLASSLDKNRFTVKVLAGQGTGELFNRLKQASIPYLKLKHTVRAINPLKEILALLELIKIFKQEKPDVIHLNSSKIGFLGSLAAKFVRPKPKVVYTSHGWVFTEPLSYPVKKLYFWLEKISSGWKDVIITVCQKDQLIAKKYNFKSKITTIHNSINPDNIIFLSKEKARQKLNLPLTKTIIGTIANLYPTKGLGYLIEAAKLLKEDDLIFAVIGEGEERKNLESLIKKYSLENNFHLLGSKTDAHQYLKAFDLYVMPSVKEGLPYAILEAQAAGLKVIATKVGGLPEIVKKESLVEAKNPQALAEKIKEALLKPDSLNNYDHLSWNDFLNITTGLYN